MLPKRAGFVLSVCLFLFSFCVSMGFAQSHEQEFALPPQEMGETLLNMGQLEPAQAIFSRLFETQAEDAYVVRGLVKSMAGMNKLEKAREQLEAYLKDHPESSAVLYGMGLIHLMERKTGPAEEFLNKAISIDPANAPALNTLAVSLYERKEYQAAIDRLHQAVEKSPGDLLVYRNLWRTYAAMDKTALFHKEFEQARQENATPRILGYGRAYAGSLRQQGFKEYQAGNLDGAYMKMKTMLEVYRDIKYSSGEVSALFSLGLLEEERGNKSSALDLYRTLLKISPNHIQGRERLQALEQDIKNQ